jgi:hypothetical protein
MRVSLMSLILLLSAISLDSQETLKPQAQIRKITVLPSEPIEPTGNCKTSTAGYLKKTSKAEIASFVEPSLQDGYIVTLYPRTKSGIFVNMECTNVSATR